MKKRQLIAFAILLSASIGALANAVTIINTSKIPLTLQYQEAYKNPGHPAKLVNTTTITLNTQASRRIKLNAYQSHDRGVVVGSFKLPMTGKWISLPKLRAQFEGAPGCWASSNKTNKINVTITQTPDGHGKVTCDTRP